MMMAVGAASGGRARPARAIEIPPKACSLRSALLIFVVACPFSGCSAVRTMTRVAAASRFAAPRPERFASPTRTTGTAAKEKKEGGEFAAGRSADPRAAAIHAVVWVIVGQAASVPLAIGTSAAAATAEAAAAEAGAAEAGAADAVPAEPFRICPCRCKGSPDKPPIGPRLRRPNTRGSSPSATQSSREPTCATPLASIAGLERTLLPVAEIHSACVAPQLVPRSSIDSPAVGGARATSAVAMADHCARHPPRDGHGAARRHAEVVLCGGGHTLSPWSAQG